MVFNSTDNVVAANFRPPGLHQVLEWRIWCIISVLLNFEILNHWCGTFGRPTSGLNSAVVLLLGWYQRRRSPTACKNTFWVFEFPTNLRLSWEHPHMCSADWRTSLGICDLHRTADVAQPRTERYSDLCRSVKPSGSRWEPSHPPTGLGGTDVSWSHTAATPTHPFLEVQSNRVHYYGFSVSDVYLYSTTS